MSTIFSHQFTKKLFICIIVVIAIGLLLNLKKLSNQQLSTDSLEEEVSQLQTEVSQLQKENSQEHTAFQKESSVRNELNMKKDNEVVLQIPIPTSEPIHTDNQAVSTIPIYKQWLKLLF